MTNPYFKDGALNREPKKPESVKTFKHGKNQIIKREPLKRKG